MAVNAVAVGELPSNELFAVRRNRRMNPSPSDEAVEVVWYDTPQKCDAHRMIEAMGVSKMSKT
ncbi:hypothetical protein CCR75_001435 [Bremia lactucae]|uniref:Uncharacterized protein n=1 Tax=Bremia lactucae TaxID=4779 RepID=A0A976FKL7_BRELC|nr:hypothetical protein CCR75_001435 [Bremia lactucae]